VEGDRLGQFEIDHLQAQSLFAGNTEQGHIGAGNQGDLIHRHRFAQGDPFLAAEAPARVDLEDAQSVIFSALGGAVHTNRGQQKIFPIDAIGRQGSDGAPRGDGSDQVAGGKIDQVDGILLRDIDIPLREGQKERVF
jgi:hypothetical protein